MSDKHIPTKGMIGVTELEFFPLTNDKDIDATVALLRSSPSVSVRQNLKLVDSIKSMKTTKQFNRTKV